MPGSAGGAPEQPGAADSIALAQRVVALLESGARQSTYKLATLLALVDEAVENPVPTTAELAVPVPHLAQRVIAYYWPQVQPYTASGPLRQGWPQGSAKGPGGGMPRIPRLIAEARAALRAEGHSTADHARESGSAVYEHLVRDVAHQLARNPLTYLQTPVRVPQGASTDFLFDASGFHNSISRAALYAHGPLVLRPGVAAALRECAPLLRPVIEMTWIADIVRFNATDLDHDDLAGFLFGADRSSLIRLHDPLRDIQHGRCFYCAAPLRATPHVDHVLPWSRIPLDGTANLVLTDARCNSNKLAMLPVRDHHERAIGRPDPLLRELSAASGLPVLLDRTTAAGIGIYTTIPTGTLLWRGRDSYEIHQRRRGTD
ncbi:HNH endonuclease [Lolliginicoccus suaedae]|uniref:HNH endonuclease n=1 Tax=Lolliginicoccus suaedae TaxID=2605429 RepID=UPI001F306875|nr:HNH endonuclease domain-containing protein [Lolliginicoccus suaedae]